MSNNWWQTLAPAFGALLGSLLSNIGNNRQERRAEHLNNVEPNIYHATVPQGEPIQIVFNGGPGNDSLNFQNVNYQPNSQSYIPAQPAVYSGHDTFSRSVPGITITPTANGITITPSGHAGLTNHPVRQQIIQPHPYQAQPIVYQPTQPPLQQQPPRLASVVRLSLT